MSLINDERVTTLAEKYNSTPQIIDDNTVFLPLSREQNIKYIEDSKKISFYQAEKLIDDKNSDALKSQKYSSASYSTTGYGKYVDLTGIVLKRFNVVSGLRTNCTVVAAINVLVRVYWEYANEREFLAVYDSGVSIDESGFFTWNETTNSAVIMSNGFLNFNGSGTITGQIDVSLSVGYERAGFSVQGSVGSTINVSKFHTIGFNFDPDYPGWHLY